MTQFGLFFCAAILAISLGFYIASFMACIANMREDCFRRDGTGRVIRYLGRPPSFQEDARTGKKILFSAALCGLAVMLRVAEQTGEGLNSSGILMLTIESFLTTCFVFGFGCLLTYLNNRRYHVRANYRAEDAPDTSVHIGVGLSAIAGFAAGVIYIIYYLWIA